MTSSVARLRSSKAKLAPQKGHGHCLGVHYSFLNLRETITSEKYAQQISQMHQKLQCLHPALVSRKGLVLLQNNARPHFAQPKL